MIINLLQPLICERFRTDARYREGHLRVVNALPDRRVMGLHLPEIKRCLRAHTIKSSDEMLQNQIAHKRNSKAKASANVQ